jgi:PAS domain-containing protein
MPGFLAAELRLIFDAIPVAALIIDAELAVWDANPAATESLGGLPDLFARRLCGEVLRCVNAAHAQCGTTHACHACVMRAAVKAAAGGSPTRRRVARMLLDGKDGPREAWFIVSAASLRLKGDGMALLMLDDVGQFRSVRGIIPICASCGRVRSDQDVWQFFETYLRERTLAQLSHGLCPACIEKFHSEMAP